MLGVANLLAGVDVDRNRHLKILYALVDNSVYDDSRVLAGDYRAAAAAVEWHPAP